MSVPPASAPGDRARSSSAPSADLRTVPLGSAGVLRLEFDGETLVAGAGETISAALLAAGKKVLRTTSRRGEPRGVFCNMGVCFECLVEVDGRANVRACQTAVRAGMRVRTQHGLGIPRSELDGLDGRDEQDAESGR